MSLLPELPPLLFFGVGAGASSSRSAELLRGVGGGVGAVRLPREAIVPARVPRGCGAGAGCAAAIAAFVFAGGAAAGATGAGAGCDDANTPPYDGGAAAGGGAGANAGGAAVGAAASGAGA